MIENASTRDTSTTLVQVLTPERREKWRPASAVPFRLTITVSLPGLKLRNLRELRAGMVFVTDTSAVEDVPVTVGGTRLGWGELDNVDGQMAIRLTRLA